MAQTVAEVMTRQPATVGRDDTVAKAAQLMREYGTGDVLVVDGGSLVGIVTDRDIVTRVVAENGGSSEPVSKACSSAGIASIGSTADVEQAVALMRDKAVRRLPVVDNGKPVGVVSLGDLAIERDPRSGLADISSAPPNS
ncbi:CBS domain-containing protein [Phaeacidiphilus oryzae]|jgi:CBS domain-containing protein|uniref:CBS domain-containing protein n=1 Tax=Phaeacidiphilus oryzae TaxID=348818 RepID=UPI00056CEA16|nr:CBS domain-containing protein [Phaeacidiphilus oryzae]